MSDMSETRHRLVTEAAKAVREAIVKRAELLQEPLSRYDTAIRSGDDKEIQTASLLLMVFASGIVDPVASELRKFAEMDKFLRPTEESGE